jgi:cell division protease FtsH
MDHSDKSPADLSALVAKGVSLVNAGKAELAKAIFDEVLARDPSCANALCGRGTALRSIGKIDEAIRDYDAALEIDPKYARAIFNRGLAHFQKGSTDEALADLNKAIEINPEPSFYFYRAQCFCQLRQYDQALRDLTTCIESDPTQPATYLQRGSVLSQQGKGKKAIRDFEEAIRLGVDSSHAYIWLAHELTNQKKYERAVSVLDRGIEIHRTDAELLIRRGCALVSASDYESAIRDFDEARRRGADDLEVVYWRGCALKQLGDYDAAIADFSEAIELDWSHFGAFVARGEASNEIHDTANAIRDLSRAIELNPRKSRPFALRGLAWWAEGNDERAMKDFDRALKLNPKNTTALQARSQLFVERGDFESSEADLDTLEDVLMKSSNGEHMAQRRTRISLLISEHFQPLPVAELTITERQFPFRVRADLQKAVNQLFDQSTRIEQFCGVKKEHSYEGISFSDLLFPTSHSPALAVPPEYEEVDIGEDEPARCLKNGLWLLAKDDLKYAVFLSPTKEHGRSTGVQFQIAVPKAVAGEQVAQGFFKHLEEAVIKSESYRGKILSLEMNEYYSGMSTGIQVHKLRTVDREQVILPAATLELLDRNIVQFARQRKKLAGLGLSTKKGLLFYGPPGTGKTHTLHYLAGAMEGHTTLLISAEQVGLLGEYMTLARLLQPSIVVIEDADLIARDRNSMESVCEEVLLNKLLNEMDGLRPDTDVFFILTTNRPQALEAALASRPGRIDQAIEFPLPDDEGRAKLVKLYSKGMDVPDDVVWATVKRTERVSASFIKELMRRAAQFHLERNGAGALTEADVGAALDEILFAGGSLNCSLLGMQREAE